MQSKHARVCLQRKGSHAARAECAQNFQRVVFLRARAEESAAKATADQAEVEAAAGALLRMPRRAAASPTGSPRLQSFDGSPLGLFGINLLSQFATIVGFCGDD